MSGVVVPVMALGYIVLALGVVLFNFRRLPEVVELIVANAFGWEQAMGGGVGAALMQGIKRGLFSNEAGMGSAPNVAATAHVSHPVKQGLIQTLGVFTDTLVICTCTAFIILFGGVPDASLSGIRLTQAALVSEIGPSAVSSSPWRSSSSLSAVSSATTITAKPISASSPVVRAR